MSRADEVIAMSSWLGERSRIGARLGIAIQDINDDEAIVALSDGQSWIAGRVEGLDDPMCEVLGMQLRQNNGLTFVARDITIIVPKLSAMVGLTPEVVNERFVGDIASLTYASGIEVQEQATASADASTALIMWNSATSQKAPAFLEAVAVPWQKLLTNHIDGMIGGVEWRVTYPELLTRVIAKLSHESLLIRECQTNDVLTRLTEALKPINKDADHDFAYNCLRYAATGYDRAFCEARFGSAPEIENEALDMIIPTVRAMAMTEYQQAVGSGKAKTIYGRLLPVDGRTSMGEVLWFTLGGSVQDILRVATVTFANNGGEVMPQVWASDAEHVHIKGWVSKAKEGEFLTFLSQLAPLDGPLAPVTLSPTVVAI